MTATVTAYETADWFRYFEELRAVIRRVVTETIDSGLSVEEKQELIDRLMAHVSWLEEWWVNLIKTNMTVEPMDLANMREQGVTHLIAFCHNDACRHQALIDEVSRRHVSVVAEGLTDVSEEIIDRAISIPTSQRSK